jgi:uncharacterized protein YabN with tetrapyrrole methylase and pyrophosphatase domain
VHWNTDYDSQETDLTKVPLYDLDILTDMDLIVTCSYPSLIADYCEFDPNRAVLVNINGSDVDLENVYCQSNKTTGRYIIGDTSYHEFLIPY